MSKKSISREYYIIEMEAVVPVKIKYKVLASSPEEALLKHQSGTIVSMEPNYRQLFRKKAHVKLNEKLQLVKTYVNGV